MKIGSGKNDMKKQVLFGIIILCLLLFGCSESENINSFEDRFTESHEQMADGTTQDFQNDAESETSEEVPEDILENYLNELPLLDSPTREYGEEAGYIQFDEDLMVHILYPECENDYLNNEIKNWLNETVEYYHTEAESSVEEGDSAELMAEYESYFFNDEIVSVKITGFYDRPYLAHPIDIIATFHANIITGEPVALENVLLDGGMKSLSDKVISDAGVSEEDADENLLDLWILKNDGIEIILERGYYLPMHEGTVTLNYRYDELTDIFSTKSEITEDTSAETEDIITAAEETTAGTVEQTEETTESETDVAPQTEIDLNKPVIALTFDDGPSRHTARLLDIFETYGGKGTFFVVGNLIENGEETIIRMAENGHEIGGHSWDHRQLTKLSEEEMNDQLLTTRAKIYEFTGIDSKMIRPPYGSYNDQLKAVCKQNDMYMVNWSVDTLDWKYRDADMLYDTIMSEVKDGAIILCHDLHGSTVDAMERIIPDLIAKGYQLVTVSELLSCGDTEIIAGTVYNRIYSRSVNG